MDQRPRLSRGPAVVLPAGAVGRAARRLGGLRSFSDRIADLDAWGLATVRDLVADGGRSQPFEADVLAGAAALARAEGDR